MAKKKVQDYIIFVDGQQKGYIEKWSGKWVWFRNPSGCDVFPKEWTAEDVAKHVAHLCGDKEYELRPNLGTS